MTVELVGHGNRPQRHLCNNRRVLLVEKVELMVIIIVDQQDFPPLLPWIIIIRIGLPHDGMPILYRLLRRLLFGTLDVVLFSFWIRIV